MGTRSNEEHQNGVTPPDWGNGEFSWFRKRHLESGKLFTVNVNWGVMACYDPYRPTRSRPLLTD